VKKYIIKRILAVIPILLVVSVVIFSLVHLTPGDPAVAILGSDATQEDILALREVMGLNDPIPVQYVNWIVDVFHGDLGNSVVSNAPVASVLKGHFLPTINLAAFAMIISLFVSLPLGMVAARKRGKLTDQVVSVIALCGISVPSFLLGLGLMMLFSVKFRIFPVSGYAPWSAGAIEHIRSLTLPAIALGFMYAALMMRMTRASMLEVLGSDYIKMAKAKGVKEGALIGIHAFKNALVSILTVIGQSIIGALSGAAVVETVFGIPGLGSLIVSSIGRRDYEVIQGIVLLIAFINVFINLITDIAYSFVDPRIRVQ
jgi:peptide/nickel transport system permease protein